jgi:protease IV
MPRVWQVARRVFLLLVIGTVWAAVTPAAQGAKAVKTREHARPTATREHVDDAAQSAQIAWFRLDGEIPEAQRDMSLFGGKRPSTMEKWLRRLAQARNDARVCAVVIEVADYSGGWAQTQELQAAIHRLREAGKPVYGYLADADLHNYAVACACDKIVLAPAGHLIAPGMRLQMWFYKDLLDKLGVQADILHIGAYKGAGEPYTRTGPTEELKEEMTNLVDGMYDQLIAQIAASRNLEPLEVRKLIDISVFSPKEAIDAKLIDRTMQLSDLQADLEDQYDATTVEDYGTKSSTSKADMSNPFAIFKMFSRTPSAEKTHGKPAIGLILMSGLIVDTSPDGVFEDGTVAPEDIQDAVDEALADDNIKAVVLRIDSPGGSSLASDIMWADIRRLLAEKPVVVSMGNVAASGGYYVASAAPMIFAEPATITGSIGVLGGKPVISGLLQKVGITTWTLERGENAGMFDVTTPFTPSQRETVLKLMNQVYGQFKSRVLTTRKDKLAKPIDDLAGGRVYTGQRALELGLVDKMGGLTDAVYQAAEQAGLKTYDIRIVPKPKSFFETLMENVMTGLDEESLGLSQVATQMVPALSDPTAMSLRRAIHRVLLQIRMLRSESVLMLMPYDTNLVPR